jgi:NADPH2:quinone reductase
MPNNSKSRRVVLVDSNNRSLSIGSEALPEPAADEVLLKVFAAGVNRPDLMQRQGKYPAPKGASPILGLEVSGEVIAVGKDVKRWKKGDLLCGLCNGGGYADFTVLPARQCLPIPKGLTLTQAAALPEVFFTVWHNVFQRGKLEAGENVLIHGGSSGIGSAAIPLAKAMGARVYATAGSAEKCAACEELGALHAVNYKTEDFVSVLQDATNGRGMDVILDMVGGEYIQKNLEMATLDGRIVNIAFQQGAKSQINFLPMLMKRLTLTASTLRAQNASQKASIAKELEEQVWPLIASGEVLPKIDSVYAFEDIEKAHARMESSEHIGKIIVEINH